MNLDNLFGIHEKALFIRERRAEMISSNLANADTPGYKAVDIDFKAALNSAQDMGPKTIQHSHARHINMPQINGELYVKYREPTQTSMDGNTVDNHVETAEFAQNSLQYQASLQFIKGRLKGILSALKGE